MDEEANYNLAESADAKAYHRYHYALITGKLRGTSSIHRSPVFGLACQDRQAMS